MRVGLERLAGDVPRRDAYLEAGASWTSVRGLEGWGEAGLRPLDSVSLFVRGFANRMEHGAMVGARWDFDLF